MDLQKFGPYSTEESSVASYELPDPLRKRDGTRVCSACEWMNRQRGDILDLFKHEEYGEILPRPDRMSFQLLSFRDDALGNTAIRKEIRLDFGMRNGKSCSAVMLLYLPKRAVGPVPAFLGLNFKGNHNTTDEADVLPTGFLAPGKLAEEARALQIERWCFREVIARGYASATLCYHDIHPDRIDADGDSVFRLFFDEARYGAISETHSVIGAWAWGLSRALDCLESEPAVDASRVAVHGHSRLGKTALWAGATDRRFAMVIGNDSGCGGAALHKRKFGENLSQHFGSHLQNGVPVWFVERCRRYIRHEERMPFDQHELLALIAPRPLCIGTATQDIYADPYGEFLACRHAAPVYRLFGSEGFAGTEMLRPDTWIEGDISFHYRTGKHDQTPWDWARYLDAADRRWKSGN